MNANQTDDSPTQAHAAETWWDLLVHAVRGTGGDSTRGPIRRAVILLAVPMVLEMVMESLFAVVDIYFVSRLGDEAMAGVALTESVLSLIYTLAMGLSIGVTAVVSRRIGGGDREGAARAAAQAVLLGLSLALVSGVAGVAFAPDILRIMGADQNVVATGVPYTRIMLGGNVVILLLFLQNAAFRGAGDAAIAMRVLWIANGLNIVLDPLLIFGLGPFPEMGVQGAAVATTIGRGTAVLVQVYTLFRLGGRLRIRLPHLGIQPALMVQLVRLSATGTLQTFIATASWIGLTRVTALFGAEALAGYVIAIRIILFAILPAWGLSNAAATMVGQALGAGDPERAEARRLDLVQDELRVPGRGQRVLHRLRAGDRGAVRRNRGRVGRRCDRPPHRVHRLRLLRLRHGADGRVQRGGGRCGRPPSSTSSASGCGRFRSPGVSRFRVASVRPACSSR